MEIYNTLTTEKYSKKFVLFQKQTQRILYQLQQKINTLTDKPNSPKNELKTQINEVEKAVKSLSIQHFIPSKKQEKFFAHIITPQNKIIKLNPSKDGILAVENQNLNGILISNAIKIHCDNNQIQQLKLPHATFVSCSNNQIKKIQYFDTPKAQQIFCNDNKITEINAPNSKYIMCHNNKIIKYNIQKNTRIFCENNPISYLQFRERIHQKPHKKIKKMDTLKTLTQKILIIEIDKLKNKTLYAHNYQYIVNEILKTYYTKKNIYKNQDQILEAIKKHFYQIQQLKNEGYPIQSDMLFENPKLFFNDIIKAKALQIINHSNLRKKIIPKNTLMIDSDFIQYFTQEILKV